MVLKTLAGPAYGQLTEKKSRFIACVAPVQSPAEAATLLEEARSRYFDARHHVWAYLAGNEVRCSDDGEPQGTAGQPVLSVLQGAGLANVAAVVTRYFGGTLLGPGGLVRAYAGAARLALESAAVLSLRRCTFFSVCCGYREFPQIAALAERLGGGAEPPVFGEAVTLRVFVPEENAAQLPAGVADITRGGTLPVQIGEKFVPVG